MRQSGVTTLHHIVIIPVYFIDLYKCDEFIVKD